MLTPDEPLMRYPDSTPTVFTGAKQFVETQGMAVWLELCDAVLPGEWFNVTEVAGKLATLRDYRNPERYLRAVLKAALADYQERPAEYDGRIPVQLRGRNLDVVSI
ncbi:MAG: hypothetical protein IPP91_17495 [Betaproteobacteria bacterium]|nr:hypothetical protein [Betaproteobacteria bacterium]